MATPQTTVTSSQGWSPDIQAFVPGDAIPDALILQTSTVAGEIQGDSPAVRVPWVDDATAKFVAEGAPIDEAEPDLAEATVRTGKIAQLLRLSREQFAQSGTPNQLSESVRRAVTLASNQAYLQQDAPSAEGDPPAGLLNVDGVTDAGEVSTDLDALADALAGIEAANGEATNVVCAPDAWGRLRKFKTRDNSNESLLGAGTNDAEKRLYNLPVLTSPAMPSGTLILLDKNAIVSAVGNVQVAQSTDAFFGSDSIGLRCTFRFGAAVMHPDRIAKLTVADPDASST
jgi:HK97 family phage major capsid protein